VLCGGRPVASEVFRQVDPSRFRFLLTRRGRVISGRPGRERLRSGRLSLESGAGGPETSSSGSRAWPPATSLYASRIAAYARSCSTRGKRRRCSGFSRSTRCGWGGDEHRFSLSDGILIKETGSARRGIAPAGRRGAFGDAPPASRRGRGGDDSDVERRSRRERRRSSRQYARRREGRWRRFGGSSLLEASGDPPRETSRQYAPDGQWPPVRRGRDHPLRPFPRHLPSNCRREPGVSILLVLLFLPRGVARAEGYRVYESTAASVNGEGALRIRCRAGGRASTGAPRCPGAWRRPFPFMRRGIA